MAKSQRALTGCGIGCGAFILILTLAIAAGYFMLRSRIHSMRSVEQSREELRQVYGDAEDFIPWLQGTIPGERIEKFLAVRASTVAAARALEAHLVKLDKQMASFEAGEEGNFWNILNAAKQGLGAIPEMAEYMRKRNESLLIQEMSLGEYSYLYVTIYYAWLKKSMRDGPSFRVGIEKWGATLETQGDADLDHEEVYAE